jgi:replicative DNA helicase
VAAEKWPDIVHGLYSVISELPITINDSKRITTGMMESEVARHTPDLVIVDHLRLIGDEPARGENETQRLGRMSWALKQIAGEYRIPVLCLCQLNRGVEARTDRRPMLGDLRQSGEIEENADAVLMLYRDEMYNDRTDQPDNAEVWGRKLRDGETNSMAKLKYHKSLTTFYDIDHRTKM